MSREAVPAGRPDEVLSGILERVTYHDEQSGFCVLRVKVGGRRELVTVVGRSAAISPGETVQAVGSWVNDRTHGPQFKASHLVSVPPETREGVERFLGSGLIRGVGPHFASRLVSAFGLAVFDVIETAPGRLRQVPGIGPVRARRVTEGWAEQKAVREIMVFLHGHGVGTSRAVRIFKTYGRESIPLIRENPYRLARDLRGIGFLTADAIAQRLGIEKTALIRARAGVSHVLAEAMDDGHCGLGVDELVPLAEEILEIPRELILEALALETKDGALVRDDVAGTPSVFLAGLYRAERRIAARLLALSRGTPPWPPIEASLAVPWVEKKLGLTLAASQREAVSLALTSKVLVITGGPGVGKTTLVRSILEILGSKDVVAMLAAPTGRAARRLADATGLVAKTVHRLLEVDPKSGGFRRGEANPLECQLLVVDEMSMVDVPLMRSLVEAVPASAALLLVGDVDQLPSVGPGQVLADVIGSGACPVVRLTEVFRQAAKSQIVTSAHRINRGLMPELTPREASDFFFVEAAEPEAAARKIVQIVRERIPKRFGLDPVRDVQVLCPMNRGALGARALNLDLQRALNPAGNIRLERYGSTYAPGDKVMQVENDYDKEVFNGDLGFVKRIDLTEQQLVIEFDGRDVLYDASELDLVSLAYATTIHKSQGSEYPAVVIPLATQHYPMLQRNLVYTGVTRGKRLVVLVGQRKALAIAVRGKTGRRRITKLREWLASPG